MRTGHHWIILRHSDDSHAHSGSINREIPDPFLWQSSHSHMLIVILQVAILGTDVVSELAVELIIQLHFAIGSFNPFPLRFSLAAAAGHEHNALIRSIHIEAALVEPLHSLPHCRQCTEASIQLVAWKL